VPSTPVTKVVEHLRKTKLWQGKDQLSDGQLLVQYLDHRDDAAFAALVRRHGPMVWGVCQRIAGRDDAEDAFQATFLIFVRKAAAVKPREAVGNWLYGVASRAALKARSASARVRAKEKQVTSMPDPATEQRDDREELQKLLDQELGALPDKYRLPVVLCDLEGRTRKEVAVQLKIPEGTLSSRLTTAHQMLAKRLARQGLALSGASLAGLLSQNAASAGVPSAVVSSTIKTATLVAAGKGALTGVVSTKVAALTEGVMKAMVLTKLKIATAAVLIIMLLAAGGTFLTGQILAGQQDQIGNVADRGQIPDPNDLVAAAPFAQLAAQGSDDPPKQKESTKVTTEWGPEKNGVRCGIALPSKEKIFAGEPVTVLVLTKNVGAKPVSIAVDGWSFLSIFTINVVGPDGKAAPLTSYGRRQMENKDGGIGGGTLLPGKEDKSGLLLSRFFDMTQKGEYKVTFSRSVTGADKTEFTVTSNVLTITVAGERAEYVPN
jgi:RNA polymerase sigma factor (sigma-70 family)